MSTFVLGQLVAAGIIWGMTQYGSARSVEEQHAAVPQGEADAGAQGPLGADAFAQLAVDLHDAVGVEETVDAVVQFALQAEACSYAGVVLTARGDREIGAVTDPVVARIYQEQIDSGEGPLLTALTEGVPVHVPDVAAETRWPAWTARLAEYGIGSVLHVPMWAGGQLIGVLALFNATPNAFDADDEAIAHILARHASVAVASARDGETMIAAVDARKLVGQAMGILMERFDLDDAKAFEILKRYSQDTNTKLRDVAQQLIDTRKLPS
ncbi:ANTAR domain protein with unknown sensor [Kribbella flavida DSM 17836]|uniref:ANTAR domain-containing protein n=1 Tax=Kribbella flavida (strain DSM 17836 / JCM 10339 / NBRC 14399) TaxID=479435 RepID=D2PQQ8_KRIFD|nr:GAF and ANTAR domain-containing protein [Kribbella flavida]ADB31041.1 ANTAR domain protein with unknown sensor [Kribbella flavida DSM 17836]